MVFQIRKNGKRIEIGMHEGEIFDILQLSRIRPNADFQIAKLSRELVASCLGVADMFVEINDEQRHYHPLCYSIIVVAGIRSFSYTPAFPGSMPSSTDIRGFRTAPFSLFVKGDANDPHRQAARPRSADSFTLSIQSRTLAPGRLTPSVRRSDIARD
jgi:hypothetical protein